MISLYAHRRTFFASRRVYDITRNLEVMTSYRSIVDLARPRVVRHLAWNSLHPSGQRAPYPHDPPLLHGVPKILEINKRFVRAFMRVCVQVKVNPIERL